MLVLGGLQPAIKAQAFSCEGHGLQSQEMRKKAKGMGGGRGEEWSGSSSLSEGWKENWMQKGRKKSKEKQIGKNHRGN